MIPLRRITVLAFGLVLGALSLSLAVAGPSGGVTRPVAHRVTAYELTGRREDGVAETIAVRGTRWSETLTAAPGVVTRLIVDPVHVVRYGMFGDAYIADRGAQSAFRIRAALLSGSLRAPSSAQTLPVPGSRSSIRYEQYRFPKAIPLELERVDGVLSAARMDAWFDYRSFRLDRAGVITGWQSASGDGFTGVRTTRIPGPQAFAAPGTPKLADGDPTAAEVDGVPIKVLIDTGTEGFGVSAALADRGEPLTPALTAMGVGGRVQQRLVRFAAFRQLGVTRTGQIARVVEELPEGYDAIEGIGMFPHLALHFDREHAVLADHRGCRDGLTFSSWAGVVTAIVRVSGAPIPFNGWALFDSGLTGPALQIAYPPRIAAAAKRQPLIDETYVGIGGSSKAHCTGQPVTFHMNVLGDVVQPVCYVADKFANTLGPAVHSSVVVNPVDFLRAPTTIDDERKLICRTPR
jgi:hypothetical protein